MSAFVLTNAKVMYGDRDLSGFLNRIALTGEVDLQENNTFGATGNYKTRLPGLFNSSMDMNGYWESAGAADSIDSDLFGKIGAVSALISISAEGATVGDNGFSLEADAASYVPGASLGEIFAFNITVQGNGPLLRGLVMENVARTTTANGAAKQVGAVTATQKVYSAIHATTVSGTTPTLDVTVESDNAEGFSSPVTRITHTRLTAVGSELLSASGAITDDWWRLVMTIGGTTPSFTIFGVVAIL